MAFFYIFPQKYFVQFSRCSFILALFLLKTREKCFHIQIELQIRFPRVLVNKLGKTVIYRYNKVVIVCTFSRLSHSAAGNDTMYWREWIWGVEWGGGEGDETCIYLCSVGTLQVNLISLRTLNIFTLLSVPICYRLWGKDFSIFRVQNSIFYGRKPSGVGGLAGRWIHRAYLTKAL